MEFKDYYKILGLERSASQDDIKRAYRKVARKFHPDINKSDEASAKFKEASEAYEVLKDPEKRSAYDQLGPNWQSGEKFRTPPEWQSDFAFSGGGYTNADRSSFSDFFETLFGRSRGGEQAFRQSQPFQATGDDQRARINVDIKDVFTGATRNLILRQQEVDRVGRAHMRERTLAVRIPKGVGDGQHIRLKGQGQPGIGGGPSGDLILEVVFNPHPLFRVEGHDIYLDLPVTPWEAALGGKINAPTPAGPVEIVIPQNARSGQKFRLKGRGIPAKTPGNLIAELKIVNPPVLTDGLRQLYERMAAETNFDPRAKLKG